MNYNDNGVIKQVAIKAGDSLPIGTVVEYEGNTIPAGYEEVSIGYLSMKVKKLWENPNPATTFNSQNITLSDSDYDYLLINYTSGEGNSVIIRKGQSANLTTVVYDNAIFLYERRFTYNSDTSYTFGDAKLNGTIRNWLALPVEILGIKLGG